MAESSFVQPTIPKFDGYYNHWAMLMENFLDSKEYWSLVEDGIPAAAKDTEDGIPIAAGEAEDGIPIATGGADLIEGQRKDIEDQKLKDLKVKNYLFQAIDRSILEIILKKDTAKDI